MATLPEDVVNRALDECGVDTIGDLGDGSRAALAATRIYVPTLRQLLSAAHWNFARKQNPLVLMADAGGQYIANTDVPGPWSYMYEWPVDAVHARFVPANTGNVDAQGNLLSNNIAWSAPSPFLVASANRVNPPDGNWGLIEGHDPDQTRVILSNQIGATLVYTGMMQYPDAWDPLFEQAMVSVLSARLAMPLIEDKKLARVIRADNISIAREAINAARVRDGNEGWTVVDHTPDWIRARTSGSGWGGPGILYNSWNSMPFVEDSGGVY
jgi:hypothetical protein